MMPYISVVCMVAALTFASSPTAAMGPSIVDAEERVRELSGILANVKNSILPRHCNDLKHAGQDTSGVYRIFHKEAGSSGQRVYCDMDTDGGGWTVIQRRGQFGNRVFHFYRNWTEYARGFGNPADEYWIGNRALHALTAGDDEQMALRVVLSNSTEDTVSVDFESFRVASEENLFKLSLGKLLGPEGWDALRTSNGQNFSTFDRDHDTWPQNCAVTFRGAWWYSSCHSSNLNGLNLNGPHDSYADGIEWSQRGTPGGYQYYSYPSVRMMIRPARSPLDRDNKLAPSSPPAS